MKTRTMNLYKKTAHEPAPHTPYVRLNTDSTPVIIIPYSAGKVKENEGLASFFYHLLSILKIRPEDT